MNTQPNQLSPAQMRGLASSSDVLHVSHLIDEFCDVFSSRIYKESVVVLQPSFVRNLPTLVWGANYSLVERGSEMDEFDDHWDSVVADMVSDWVPEAGNEPF